MVRRYRFYLFLFVLLGTGLFFVHRTFPQNHQSSVADVVQNRLTLDLAVMCEEVIEKAPINQAVIFSIKIGKVSCFSAFDPVPEKTFIYHKWFHRDTPSTNKRLTLQPPRWATYSSIQLREADKGPWRVEISDRKGKLLQILRFSITD